MPITAVIQVSPTRSSPLSAPVALSLCLALATVACFSRLYAGGFGFITIDDDEYVVENPQVSTGLSASNLVWAFTRSHSNNWHPLTWLSLQLDAQLFGSWAPGYHLHNVLLHAGAAVFLFLALAGMTGSVWRSVFAAGLFALHPLRVESVAWVAERKDVLSALLGMLALWAYAGYARRPTPARYGAVAAALALGLLAKPTLVTLPCLLLLLDFWPLRRLRLGQEANAGSGAAPVVSRVPAARLLAEKLPLLALAAVSAAVTVRAQREVVQSLHWWPWWVRLSNALVAYVGYLRMMFWPEGLAIFYPHPGRDISIGLALAAGAFLALVTAGVMAQARRRPYLLVGWLWYLGALVPVIGLVQVGLQARADRYTYLPSVGIAIMLSWGLAGLPGAERIPRLAWAAGAGAVLGACACATWVQTQYWKDGVTVLQRAAAVTRPSATVEHCLGEALVKAGDSRAAQEHFQSALRLDPNDMFAHKDLGVLFGERGQLDQAVDHFRQAARLDPTWADARSFLGQTLIERAQQYHLQALRWEDEPRKQSGTPKLEQAAELRRLAESDLQEAVEEFRVAVRLAPQSPVAYANLGKALLMQGHPDQAESCFRQSLALLPEQSEVRMLLGLIQRMRTPGRAGAPPRSGPTLPR